VPADIEATSFTTADRSLLSIFTLPKAEDADLRAGGRVKALQVRLD
jgi:hypothetical protein